MRINLYDQNRHVVMVDGVPVTSFANGDHIQVKLDGGAATRTQGGDGPAMNLTTPQGGQITLSLLPTSAALGILYELRAQQSVSPRLFSVVLMTGVQETIRASGCAFGELPQFGTGGAEMSARQFVFEARKIDLDTSALEAVAGGLV